MIESSIFPSAYFAPIDWYRLFLQSNEPLIDRHEHYRKQTWRNRCRIVGPNGVQDLVVPVHFSNHTPLQEVRIDYSERWQQRHWGAIRSAYGQSPFFAHYAYALEPFFIGKNCETLLELNTVLLEITLRLLKQDRQWKFTQEFIPYAENDLRLLLSPKRSLDRQPAATNFQPYIQVFAERHGFLPNLSILDLLFCCGPAAAEYLLRND